MAQFVTIFAIAADPIRIQNHVRSVLLALGCSAGRWRRLLTAFRLFVAVRFALARVCLWTKVIIHVLMQVFHVLAGSCKHWRMCVLVFLLVLVNVLWPKVPSCAWVVTIWWR